MNKLTENQKKKYNLPSCEIYYDMDGFVYQRVLPSEVSDLLAMGKEVYQLYDDDSESLVVDCVANPYGTFGIEVGFLEELGSKAMFDSINQGLGLQTNTNAYTNDDYQAMLETLNVAMDEFSQIYNHSASNDFREYYEKHMTQLDNIINLINKLK